MGKRVRQQLRYWSIIINNNLDEDQFKNLKIKEILKLIFNRYIFQLERGEEKERLHYQIYAHSEQKKEWGPLLDKLHDLLDIDQACITVTPASTNGKLALENYCMKDDTRVDGPWADRKIKTRKDILKVMKTPYPWQKQLMDLIEEEPDERSIHWIINTEGNVGKSKFGKAMGVYRNALMITFGSYGDLVSLINNYQELDAYIIDLPRTKPSDCSMKDIYTLIEALKNGYIINTKYQATKIDMDPPHVIVFSNHPPDKSCLTEDRWHIHSLESPTDVLW